MKKILLMIIGTISLGLGMLGVLLPILPTTPFLLLSLACYIRSNKRLYDYALNHKLLGSYVKDFVSNEGIPLKSKKRVIILIWISIGLSVIFFTDKIFLRIILLAVATIISCFIWTRKTLSIKTF